MAIGFYRFKIYQSPKLLTIGLRLCAVFIGCPLLLFMALSSGSDALVFLYCTLALPVILCVFAAPLLGNGKHHLRGAICGLAWGGFACFFIFPIIYYLAYRFSKYVDNLDEPFGRCDPDTTDVLEIAAAGAVEKLEAVLTRRPEDVHIRNSQGFTAMHKAAIYDQVESMKILLYFDADLDAQDNEGRTPLHHAVRHGNKRFIEAALAAGANPEVKDGDDAGQGK